MKKVLYTAIFGKYDDLALIDNNKGWRKICFTDQDFDIEKIPGWEIIKVVRPFKCPSRSNRFYKLLIHRFIEFDYAVYMDGNFEVIGSLDDLIGRMTERDFMVFDNKCKIKNPRNCIYDEAVANLKQRKDDEQLILQQMAFYRREKYPEDNGLISGGVLVRKNTEEVKNMTEEWWKQLEQFSFRDQLSFNYVCWKIGFKYHAIQSDIKANKWFKAHLHVKDQKLALNISTSKDYKLTAFTPYSLTKNLGLEYNRCMDMIGERDWACLMDHDMMFLTLDWYRQLCYAIENLPNAGLITVMTNRLGNRDQVHMNAKELSDNHDIKHHRIIAKSLMQKKGNHFLDVTHKRLIGGVVMVTSKRAWRAAGTFPNGLISIDNIYHQRIREAGYKVYIAQGVYVYHWRRGEGETKAHLL